jgi:predicted DCC family thiol-disulfide oxidoreductase YuxK
MTDGRNGGVVLFDGVCALCNRTVQHLLERDRRGVLRFAPLQGPTAAALWQRHPGRNPGLKTMVYVRDFGTPDEVLFFRSRAVLEILSDLGGPWRWVRLARLIPGPIRDAVYNAIARRRYAWFGRYDACRLPSPGQEERFLP